MDNPVTPEQLAVAAALRRHAEAFIEMAKTRRLDVYDRDDLLAIIHGNANVLRSILYPPDQGSDG